MLFLGSVGATLPVWGVTAPSAANISCNCLLLQFVDHHNVINQHQFISLDLQVPKDLNTVNLQHDGRISHFDFGTSKLHSVQMFLYIIAASWL